MPVLSKLLYLGVDCDCDCRHRLNFLCRAKTEDPKYEGCPGIEAHGSMCLKIATQLASCNCCDRHQCNRVTADELDLLFGSDEHYGLL